MRTCFAHGGQLAQINLGRRIQGFDGDQIYLKAKAIQEKLLDIKTSFLTPWFMILVA